jgi:aminotransferase in exopolysaccharide biosynthesis
LVTKKRAGISTVKCENILSTKLINFIRDYYSTNDVIPLHAPVFVGAEEKYVVDTIRSTFVSSVGEFVNRFENDMAAYLGCDSAVTTVNGTAALHIALKLVGVEAGDLVITQSLTFVATCNAIKYIGADPVFIDVDRHTLGLSAKALGLWLDENAVIDDDGICRDKLENRIIRACVPMHTFGHPVDLDGLLKLTKIWKIALVEDAAESLGSFYKDQHTGTFGEVGTLSFNGNKIITTGGGGMILSDQAAGKRAKHLTTTAKKPHPYEYVHDEVGYNYRMPNLNAALGLAQLEMLESFVTAKRSLASFYDSLLLNSNLLFVREPPNCRSNYWLNAVICEDRSHRDHLLKITNTQRIMTRPIWTLMSHLDMYKECRRGDLETSEWLEARVVNLPSSVVLR